MTTNSQTLIVAGVARSGTTYVYERLGQAIDAGQPGEARFFYEPYLWKIDQFPPKGHTFSNEFLNPRGIHVHTSTPLFCESDTDHETWIRETLVGVDYDVLAKVIRGCGRLGDYLAADPGLKVLVVLRNPLDVVNSVHGQFSIFGDEFYPSDWPKLRDTPEFQALGHSKSHYAPVERTTAWVSTMMSAAAKFISHERVLALPYEFLVDEPGLAAERIRGFVPSLDLATLNFERGDAAAGPTTSRRHVRRCEVASVKQAFERYLEILRSLGHGDLASELPSKLNKKYSELRWAPGIHAFTQERSLNPLQVRTAEPPASPQLATTSGEALDLDEEYSKLADQMRLDHFNWNRWAPGVLTGGNVTGTSGCVITAHNDEATLSVAINSVLDQTMPYDQIVVVDDASVDSTGAIARHYESAYPTVEVLTLSSNVGPSAARDLGINKLETEFISHVDADDALWPTKNFEELLVVSKNESTIAFSDVLLRREEDSVVLSTALYETVNTDDRNYAFVSRAPTLPRDMTLSKDLYLHSGGYDYLLSMFEDYDFKLRLSTEQWVSWKRSGAPVGTLYNRRTAGLSKRPNLVQIQHVLHMIGRNRAISSLSEDDFNNAAIEALEPFDCEHKNFIMMLLGYVGWSHYDRLADPQLLGFNGDELVVEIIERLTDLRAAPPIENTLRTNFSCGEGFGAQRIITQGDNRVQLREIVDSRATVHLDVPANCGGLIFNLCASKGSVHTVRFKIADAIDATTRDHPEGFEEPSGYLTSIKPSEGKASIELLTRASSGRCLRPLESENLFLESVMAVLG